MERQTTNRARTAGDATPRPTAADRVEHLIQARAEELSPQEALRILLERLGPLPSALKVQLGAPDRLPALIDAYAAIRCLERLECRAKVHDG